MDFLGTWYTKKAMTFTEDGVTHLSKEEMEAKGLLDEDSEQLFDSGIEIKADGTIVQFVVVPPEVAEQAKAEGEAVDEQGHIIVGEATWKETENGPVYCMDGQEMPLELDNGLLKFAMGLTLMEKA